MQVYEAGYTADREDLTCGEDPYLMFIEELLNAFDSFDPANAPVEMPEVGESDTEEEPF